MTNSHSYPEPDLNPPDQEDMTEEDLDLWGEAERSLDELAEEIAVMQNIVGTKYLFTFHARREALAEKYLKVDHALEGLPT